MKRLTDGMPGQVMRFVAKKMKGRENIRGAMQEAVEAAAIKFSKDPRTIGGYRKAAKPLQDINFVASACVDLLKDPSALFDPASTKATLKAIRDALAMLSFIQQHLTVAERARFAHLKMIELYDIARIKAGKPLSTKYQKSR